MLGLVYSAWTDGAGTAARRAQRRAARARRPSSTSARSSTRPRWPPTSTCRSLTARLQLRAGKGDEAVPFSKHRRRRRRTWREPYMLLAEARSAWAACRSGARRWSRPPRSTRAITCRSATLREAGPLGRGRGRLRPGGRRACVAEPRLRLRYVSRAAQRPRRRRRVHARKTQLTELLKTNPDDARRCYLLSTRLAATARTRRQPRTRRGSILAIDPTSLAGLSALARTLMDQYQYRRSSSSLTPLSKDLRGAGEGPRDRRRVADGAARPGASAAWRVRGRRWPRSPRRRSWRRTTHV